MLNLSNLRAMQKTAVLKPKAKNRYSNPEAQAQLETRNSGIMTDLTVNKLTPAEVMEKYNVSSSTLTRVTGGTRRLLKSLAINEAVGLIG